MCAMCFDREADKKEEGQLISKLKMSLAGDMLGTKQLSPILLWLFWCVPLRLGSAHLEECRCEVVLTAFSILPKHPPFALFWGCLDLLVYLLLYNKHLLCAKWYGQQCVLH